MLTFVLELITGSKTADIGVKNAMMKALQEVVGKAGANMSEASRQAILGLIDDDASDQTGKISFSAFWCVRWLIDLINVQILLPSPTPVFLVRL